MVLHLWLIPAILILCLVVVAFYLVLKRRGGSGERTRGRTVFDKPDEPGI